MDLLRSKQLFDNIEEINLEEQDFNYQKDFINKITSEINETILVSGLGSSSSRLQ